MERYVDPHMKDVLIYIKPDNNDADKLAGDLSDFLAENKRKSTCLKIGQNCTEKDNIDLVIVLGGDGSFLAATRSVNAVFEKKKSLPPILGVNMGSLGFLTECRAEESLDVLKRGLDRKFDIEHRTMLDADGISALNDIAITRKSIARVVDFDLFINDEFVASIKADGVIVSTPTGSTAYSLAAGGPILHPELGAFVITPISPHTLTNRPIVVSDLSTIKIKIGSDHGDDVVATLDGQLEKPFNNNGEFLIKRHHRALQLVRPYGKTYFSILRDKLAFGRRGHN